MTRTRFALLAAAAVALGGSLSLPTAQPRAMRTSDIRTADGDGGSATHGAPAPQEACAAARALRLADGDGGSPAHGTPQPQFA
jgi:hypothetical protein